MSIDRMYYRNKAYAQTWTYSKFFLFLVSCMITCTCQQGAAWAAQAVWPVDVHLLADKAVMPTLTSPTHQCPCRPPPHTHPELTHMASMCRDCMLRPRAWRCGAHKDHRCTRGQMCKFSLCLSFSLFLTLLIMYVCICVCVLAVGHGAVPVSQSKRTSYGPITVFRS